MKADISLTGGTRSCREAGGRPEPAQTAFRNKKTKLVSNIQRALWDSVCLRAAATDLGATRIKRLNCTCYGHDCFVLN